MTRGATSAVARRALDWRIAALAVPSLGALAAEPLYVLVDTAIVGHIGTDALAGLAIAGTTLTALTWLVGFLSMGTTTRIATAVGAGRADLAATAVGQAALVATALGLVLLGLVQVGAGSIVAALGGHGPAARAAVTYLRVGSLGVPFQLLAFVGHAWWRGHLRVTRSLQVVVAANTLNVALEVVFVYGLRWGIAGSAWGTVAAQVVAAAWLAVGVRRAVGRGADGTRPAGRDRWAGLGAMASDGWRITLRTLAHVTVFVLASATAARLGTSSLGAHQIGMQLFTFLALSLDALAVPAQVFTGQAIGAGRPTEAAGAVTRCLVLAVGVGVVVGGVVAASSGVLAGVFTHDHAVTAKAVVVLVLLGATQVPGAIAFVLDGALLGAADYRGLQRATIGAALTFAPFAAAVLAVHRLGLVTLWAGLFAWMCMRALLNWQRWQLVAARAGSPRVALSGSGSP